MNSKFYEGQRVCIPGIPNPMRDEYPPDRNGTIQSVEVLSNGFQRIIVNFDADNNLGTREVHPKTLKAIS